MKKDRRWIGDRIAVEPESVDNYVGWPTISNNKSRQLVTTGAIDRARNRSRCY